MTTNETCPYCGAGEKTQTERMTSFECGTVYLEGFLYERDCQCYDRQLAQQAAEIEQLPEKIKQAAERARREAFNECEKICFDVWKNSYAEETAPVGQIAQHLMYVIKEKGKVK